MAVSLKQSISDVLRAAGSLSDNAAAQVSGPVRTGIDLGTATCVLVTIDEEGAPVWIDATPTAAIRDGVVVDFAEAAAATTRLRARAEERLQRELTTAATCYPPCVGEAESRACRFVLEAAGFEEVSLIDEVSAANLALGVRDGVVVDVGGGSTGVGVFRNGSLELLDDRPGGGHHLDLILSGAFGIDQDEAERRKREGSDGEFLSILRPGFERIAQNIADLTRGADDLDVHLAGGALMYPGADSVIAAFLDRTVHSYPNANLITPLGIARSVA
ncbi:ethanolamine utilization protein EutJ [Gordonia hydrophobica]|uniref:Ethanolamine utilization protein EutJ n=1 Tax=Gordonia hydrophobica TaxID=40516 RepID=A0ABZ2U6Q1_9ACTN|nr:ethanolamine utilization protein EutJ [Gordonia hydrophobica]MBM7365383.1 ethanolamine utilization protein EutJ [Gordonia hydrophobica]